LGKGGIDYRKIKVGGKVANDYIIGTSTRDSKFLKQYIKSRQNYIFKDINHFPAQINKEILSGQIFFGLDSLKHNLIDEIGNVEDLLDRMFNIKDWKRKEY